MDELWAAVLLLFLQELAFVVHEMACNMATEDEVHMCYEMRIRTEITIYQLMEVSSQFVLIPKYATDRYFLRAGKLQDLLGDRHTQSKAFLWQKPFSFQC